MSASPKSPAVFMLFAAQALTAILALGTNALLLASPPIRTPADKELDEIECQSMGVAKVEGRAAAIDRYRQWIKAHPDAPECLRAGWEIAKIQGWRLPQSVAADRRFIVEEYRQAIEKADNKNPLLPALLVAAAQTANELDRQLSDSFYQRLYDLDPNSDVHRLQAFLGLGKNAVRAKELDKAENYFKAIMDEPWPARPGSDNDELFDLKRSAAGELFFMATGGYYLPPETRLEKIEKLLKKYPDLSMILDHGETVSKEIIRLKSEIKKDKGEHPNLLD